MESSLPVSFWDVIYFFMQNGIPALTSDEKAVRLSVKRVECDNMEVRSVHYCYCCSCCCPAWGRGIPFPPCPFTYRLLLFFTFLFSRWL